MMKKNSYFKLKAHDWLRSKTTFKALCASLLVLSIHIVLIFSPQTTGLRFWEPLTIAAFVGAYYYFGRYQPKKYAEKGIIIPEDFWKTLDKLVQSSKGRLPSSIQSDLEAIQSMTKELIPIYPKLNPDTRHYIKHSIIEYIPKALENYWNLPRSLRPKHSTGYKQLKLQLKLIVDSFADALDQAGKVSLQEVRIHTRFLQQRALNKKAPPPEDM